MAQPYWMSLPYRVAHRSSLQDTSNCNNSTLAIPYVKDSLSGIAISTGINIAYGIQFLSVTHQRSQPRYSLQPYHIAKSDNMAQPYWMSLPYRVAHRSSLQDTSNCNNSTLAISYGKDSLSGIAISTGINIAYGIQILSATHQQVQQRHPS